MYEKIKHKFIDQVIEHPYLCLLLGLTSLAFFLYGLVNFKANFTPRIWFGPETKYIKKVDDFERTFGSDQFIALGMKHESGVLTEKALATTRELADKLWQLPDIIRVESLATYNYVQTQEDDIVINPLADEDVSVEEIRRRVDDSPELNDFFISPDRKLTIFQLQVKPFFGESHNYSELMEKLAETIKPYKDQGYSFQMLGSAAVTYSFREIAKEDNRKILPILFVVVLLMLGFYFKSVNGVLIPLTVSLATIGSALGIMGHFDYTFNSILGAIPGIVLAICLADTVHLLTTYGLRLGLGESSKQALRYSMEKNFLATVLTSLTTAISFFTIANTELVPISNLGVLSGIGCFLAWIFTYLYLPAMILIFPKKFNRPLHEQKGKFSLDITSWPAFIAKNRITIIVIFCVLSVAALFTSLYNEVNSDPVNYFAEETRIRQDFKELKKHIQGTRSVDFVVDSGETDGVKAPEFLNKADSFIKELLKDDEIVQINSLMDAIKRVNEQIEGEGKRLIPQSREKVAAVLLLYQMGLPASLGIENQMSVDGRKLRLRVKWTTETTKDAMRKEGYVYKVAEKYGLKVYSGGYFPIYTKINDMVFKSFFKSMGTAILLVSLIIFLVFRDLKISLLAMLPNVIPLTIGGAYMAIFGIYIDIGTSIVSAICLGIAVDDTIHFIVHFLKNRSDSNDDQKALETTFAGTGRALVMTTVLLVVGFGSFIFADFLPNRYFGFLCALVLTFALLTDLLFLPAIMLRPKKDAARV